MINKITKVFPTAGIPFDEDYIQAHIDEQNADGWQLVAVDNMVNWYRLFWAKEAQNETNSGLQ